MCNQFRKHLVQEQVRHDVVNDVESRRRPAGRELAEFRDDTARALGPEPPILSVQPAEPARRSLRPPTATRCLENDGRERAADAVLTSPRRKEVGEVGDGEIVEPLNECRFAASGAVFWLRFAPVLRTIPSEPSVVRSR